MAHYRHGKTGHNFRRASSGEIILYSGLQGMTMNMSNSALRFMLKYFEKGILVEKDSEYVMHLSKQYPFPDTRRQILRLPFYSFTVL